MRKQITVILIMISSVMPGARGFAQIAANPAGTIGDRDWSISVNGGYFHQQVSQFQNALDTRSHRIFLKVNRGLFPWLDFYALGGAADLTFLNRSEDITDYKDKYRFAYGGGFNLAIAPFENKLFQLWAGGQAFRFQSEGTLSIQTYDAEDDNLILSVYNNEYDWREIKAFAGVILDFNTVSVYFAGAGWILDREDAMSGYRERNASTIIPIPSQTGGMNTGLWTGGIAGIEFRFAGNYAITIEGLAFNRQNFQIMIGVSQTGSPKWQPLLHSRQ